MIRVAPSPDSKCLSLFSSASVTFKYHIILHSCFNVFHLHNRLETCRLVCDCKSAMSTMCNFTPCETGCDVVLRVPDVNLDILMISFYLSISLSHTQTQKILNPCAHYDCTNSAPCLIFSFLYTYFFLTFKEETCRNLYEKKAIMFACRNRRDQKHSVLGRTPALDKRLTWREEAVLVSCVFLPHIYIPHIFNKYEVNALFVVGE